MAAIHPQIARELNVCRICLITNVKLYRMSDELELFFDQVMDPACSLGGELPRVLCAWCRRQLLRAAALRARSRRAHALLVHVLQRPHVTVNDIHAIDRDYYKLSLNLSTLSVYSFDSTRTSSRDSEVQSSHMDADDFDDRGLAEVDGNSEVNEVELADPLTEAETKNTVIDCVTDSKEPKNRLVVEIDGLNLGCISVKKLEVVEPEKKSKKTRKKDKDVKKKRISNLLRYVAGKKRNAKPLTKWQLQLRRAENDFLPNFDHAEFEAKHECKLKILTMEEQLAEIEERRQSSNYMNQDYKCEQCGRGFEFEKPYKNHMAKHDPSIGKFECEVCHARFRTRYLRHRHLDYHRLHFTCSLCGFVSRAKHNARNHYLMHTGKVFKCKQCDATFTKSTSYYGHVRLNHPSAEYACADCGDSFVGALGLRHHRAKAHRQLSEAKYECKSCGVQFVSSGAMSAHTDGRTHCDASLKACAECGAVCAGEAALRAHTDTRHVFPCTQCPQSFASQGSLQTHHQRIHLHIKWPAYGRTQEMNKEYYRRVKARSRARAQAVCELCGAGLRSNAALERHQQGRCEREKTKSFKCLLCDKAYATKQGLQLHESAHTGQKHKCGQCEREFRQAGALRRHQAVHQARDKRGSAAPRQRQPSAASLAHGPGTLPTTELSLQCHC